MGAGSSSSGQGSGISDLSEQERSSGAGSSRGQAETRYEKSCFFNYITAIARIWGILLFIGLWGCAVQSFTQDQYKYSPYYLLSVAVLVTFLELVWILNKCFLVCCRDEGCCCRVWKAFVWVDDWRKAVIYLLLTLPCYFTKELRHLFPLLAVGLLIVAAVLYFLKSFRDSSCVKRPVGQGSRQDPTDPKAHLIASEQRTYDSVAPPGNGVAVTSNIERNLSVTPSDVERRSPVTSSDNEKRLPVREKSSDEEVIPVGYKHNYGAPRQGGRSPAPRRSRSANPFDDDKDVTDSAMDVERGLKRAPSTNPFDEDYHGPPSVPAGVHVSRSTNPFDEA